MIWFRKEVSVIVLQLLVLVACPDFHLNGIYRIPIVYDNIYSPIITYNFFQMNFSLIR